MVVVERGDSGGGVTHRLGDERRGVIGEDDLVEGALTSLKAAELELEQRD
jgi:hypothetical protein